MRTFNCNIAQPGLFAGHIALVNNEAGSRARGTGTSGSELEAAAFKEALSQLKKELGGDPGNPNTEIMDALTMILEDESFTGGVLNTINNYSCPAADAVKKQTDSIIAALEASDSDILRGRSEDIRGISNRLINIINGEDNAFQVLEPSAIASHEISPVLLSSIHRRFVGAIISGKGSPVSHTSIMAGNMGVPYLFGAGEAISQMKNGQAVIVDGDRGILILDPDSETFQNALEKMEAIAAERDIIEQDMANVSGRIKIMANISGPEDIPELLKSGADGIGLFRTELIFLNSLSVPTEEKQLDIYNCVLEAMEGREAIIRTMDLGSDKTVGWLDLPEETNPALGLRGARVSLVHRDLLNIQLRALLRAAVKGNLKIMFPMIASEWEVDELIKAVLNAARELENEGIDYAVPELGIMIETPSAVMIADRLAEKVSFFSIGTNDLAQYTLGIDRENEDMDMFFDPRHESVLRLIELTVQKAHEKGIRVGICGQLAADPAVTTRLVSCGIDELSVSVEKVKATRKNVALAEDGLNKKDDASAAADEMEIAAVADGELIPMNDIPDETFAEGILGPCVGILPENGNVYSPCDGTVKSIGGRGHAIVIEAGNGAQYLVHIGIDTVHMKEKAFDVRVDAGQCISMGDLIAVADLGKIEKEGFSTIIVTVRLLEGIA